MPKPAKSQWDFGELFPVEQTRKIMSVAELTGQIRRVLEKQVGQVWVTGEITNLKLQSSGHVYFTLKDASAQLSCVLFRGETQADRSLLLEGRTVVLQGEITVYEPRGAYQLRVARVELQGLGALQAAFEKLKEQLKAEGLFAPERKRPIPRFPQRIGVVTSPTGAALRDVLHVASRRNPSLEILLAPCRVQGEGAAQQIAGAIRLLNRYDATQRASGQAGSRLDVILVTRGGGSLEDLWAFNEEVVARAIVDSALPIVSAVGHEIDFTISDFVADLRAATPSAAAEILTEGVFSSAQFIERAGENLGRLARERLAAKRDDLEQELRALSRLHPRRRVQDLALELDDFQERLLRCGQASLRLRATAWNNLRDRFSRVRPRLVVQRRAEALTQAGTRLRELVRQQAADRANRLGLLATRLRLLGPEQVLARGYSITMDAATGKIMKEAAAAKAGQRLKTRLHRGELRSRVEP